MKWYVLLICLPLVMFVGHVTGYFAAEWLFDWWQDRPYRIARRKGIPWWEVGKKHVK